MLPARLVMNIQERLCTSPVPQGATMSILSEVRDWQLAWLDPDLATKVAEFAVRKVKCRTD